MLYEPKYADMLLQKKKKKAILEARTDHENLRAHFTSLVGQCEASFNDILRIFDFKIDD